MFDFIRTNIVIIEFCYTLVYSYKLIKSSFVFVIELKIDLLLKAFKNSEALRYLTVKPEM